MAGRGAGSQTTSTCETLKGQDNESIRAMTLECSVKSSDKPLDHQPNGYCRKDDGSVRSIDSNGERSLNEKCTEEDGNDTGSSSSSFMGTGNYDVILNDEDDIISTHSSQIDLDQMKSFRNAITKFLDHFERHESELITGQVLQQDDQQDHQQTPHLFEGGYASEFRLLKELSKILREDKSNLIEGEHELNLKKNRYKDIIPFSHSRVVLSSNPEVPFSCYINANFIRGSTGFPKTYIACQGPLPCTLDDFWRMIWECDVSVVVMACNFEESGKPKCELYWPEYINSSQCYGNIEVKLVEVRQICSDFLVRKFVVKLIEPATGESIDTPSSNQNDSSEYEVPIKSDSNFINNNNDESTIDFYLSSDQQQSSGKVLESQFDRDRRPLKSPESKSKRSNRMASQERVIWQFHYTTWPDHGVPNSVEPILELVRLMREVQLTETKPILIHCSAGCGRTGTICCIDYVWSLLKRGKLDLNFDLCRIIGEMRQQRMAMVQTLEQYILCHRAVASLFLKQLDLIDQHIYENLDHLNGDDELDEHDLGPVFI